MNDKISDDLKLQLIRKAISTQAGWKSLAQSVQNNPTGKNECIRLLKIIGGNANQAYLGELLVTQLEENINKLEE